MNLTIFRHVVISHQESGLTWSICPISGVLEYEVALDTIILVSVPKVVRALKYCDNPFLCLQNHTAATKLNVDSRSVKKLTQMHRIFRLIGSHHFYLSTLYARIQCGIFANTTDAMVAIANLPSIRESRHRLCLQKTLLAIKTSKSFKKSGVLFIGAKLPTCDMHAWIIEDGVQPDVEDRIWINFRPLLAIYCE